MPSVDRRVDPLSLPLQGRTPTVLPKFATGKTWRNLYGFLSVSGTVHQRVPPNGPGPAAASKYIAQIYFVAILTASYRFTNVLTNLPTNLLAY